MTENQTQPPAEPKPSNRKWIALGIGGGCALLACVALVTALTVPAVLSRVNSSVFSHVTEVTLTPSASSSLAPVVMPPARQHPQADGNKMGDPNAPVKIVEYADFQCPYCMRYWEDTEPQIIQTYVATGKVYYEYRSVGEFIGPESAAAAAAAYCAGDQGKFWEYHDLLFANWTGENVGDFAQARLQQFASTLGLNIDQFNTCLNNGNYTARVNQDVSDAKAAGVRATPSFVINGKLLEGAQPFDAFQQMIEAALQGQ